MAQLMVSLSGLTDDATASGADLAAALDARGVPLSLLLRPVGAVGPVHADSPLVRWLRERRACGDALLLHGYDHAPDPTAAGQLAAMARMGRRAEFAALPRHEAGLRLTAARRVLTAISLRTDVFAAPRWLASPGTVQALREQGFAVLADDAGVRRLDGAGSAVLGRVLGLRSRSTAEAWGYRLLSAEAARVARRGGAVRLDVRAGDLDHPARVEAVLAAVDAALDAGARPTTYRLAALTQAA
jgi:predicted deacetylase